MLPVAAEVEPVAGQDQGRSIRSDPHEGTRLECVPPRIEGRPDAGGTRNALGALVIVLAITRIPIYLRTSRAEVLEIRERMFVQAAQVMGASTPRIVLRHILPMVLPTLVTIATLDFAFVMLAESALSFLGIGIQPPEITWGLMVSQGRPYLTTAWWLSFWPGLAIILTTLSLNLLSSWMRTALDPVQRWRLEARKTKNG